MARINRRTFLGALGALSLPAWFPRMTFGATGTGGDLLVCVFLRGGADALNMFVPFTESRYYDRRKTLAIAEPGAANESAIDLDGRFGLHPNMAPLLELYQEGLFAPVIAAGLEYDTHSHFDAMEFMESGLHGEKNATSGWIGRHLQTRADKNSSPFRAISIGDHLPTSLRGPVPATALSSIEEFHFETFEARARNFQQTLQQMYNGGGILDAAALQTVEAIQSLTEANPGDTPPANGAAYLDDEFNNGLREIVKIARAEIGLEIACIDFGGWDTHNGQGSTSGWMANNLNSFSRGLQAFITDLGDLAERTTVVVMSEFGRRINENASGGTDHGHGGAMMVLGGTVVGGMVHGSWPGLEPDNLYGPGDLAITTDYRTVLAEILEKRLGNADISTIFPGFDRPADVGVIV